MEAPRLIVRALTAFLPQHRPAGLQAALQEARATLHRLRDLLEQEGFTVQTLRASTLPFPQWETQGRPWMHIVEKMVSSAEDILLNLGYVDPLQHGDAALEALPQLLGTFPVYASVLLVPFGEKRILGRRVWAAARTIDRLARVGREGEANTRFAAAAWVPPYGPFFPASWAAPGETRWQWAMALETGGLLYFALQHARRPQEAAPWLRQALEQDIQHLTRVIQQAGLWDRFRGFDLSWAPYPEEGRSVAHALAQWKLPLGWHGTLALAGWLTQLLRQVQVPRRTGYFGLMLPVMEDPGLAQAIARGTLDTRGLLAASALCAVGLDTVPLPGEVTPEQLATVLWDVAVLAARLEKPLTARLVPIPGYRAGEQVPWQKPFFLPATIPELPAQPLPALDEHAVIDLT